MRTPLKALGLTALAMLALTGCMKVEANYTLHANDTVDGTMIMGIQKGIGESLGMADSDLLGELSGGVGTDDLEGATVEPFEDETWVGEKITFTGMPLADLSEDDTGVSITRDGNDFVVAGDPLAGDQEIAPSDLPGAEMTLSITFPGDVTEHNGTLEGSTVTWDLLTMDEPLMARGTATTGLPSWVWIAIAGAIVVLVTAAVVIVVMRKRSANGDAPAEDLEEIPAFDAETGAAGDAEPVASDAVPPTLEMSTEDAGVNAAGDLSDPHAPTEELATSTDSEPGDTPAPASEPEQR